MSGEYRTTLPSGPSIGDDGQKTRCPNYIPPRAPRHHCVTKHDAPEHKRYEKSIRTPASAPSPIDAQIANQVARTAPPREYRMREPWTSRLRERTQRRDPQWAHAARVQVKVGDNVTADEARKLGDM
ncbi:hypothetical protein OH77DRAFT_1431523 [Trametes cingulata]|nr:hypothetical protein OH77DRAFT_1431523 [Trametes cingulata]